MELTAHQKNAVEHRGPSLLVSAGAGSGKTSTLAERIIRRISDPNDPAEIDDFLIVTFTNASAADLSEKIERAVADCAARDFSNRKALRQLAKIKYANISTISSFCLGVVKKHFQLLGLPAKLRICDAAEAEMLRSAAVLDVLEEKYAECEEGSAFFDAVELFSGSKNDEPFAALLEKLHTKIVSFPDPDAWCEEVLARYLECGTSAASDLLGTSFGSLWLSDAVEALNEYVRALKAAAKKADEAPDGVLAPYAACFLRDAEAASDALERINPNDYEKTCEALSGAMKSRVPPVKCDNPCKEASKKLRDNAFSEFSDVRRKCFSAPAARVRAAADDTRRVLEVLFSLVKEIDLRYRAAKTERGLIDFSDAERYTYGLFYQDGKTTDTAAKYRDAFAEIYIDEYQDINPIQDAIFRAICRYDASGCEYGRFMVGDMKQSIYRFRGARPELFGKYLDTFSMIGEKGEKDAEGEKAEIIKDGAQADDRPVPKKEYLSENFRCAQSVVDFSNLVFSELMGKAYGENDRLVYARHEAHPCAFPCEAVYFSTNETEEADYYDDEIKAAAQEIFRIVGASQNGDGTPYGYGDIALLLPTMKNTAEKYAKYFENCSIPVYSEVSENFFENAEILLCLCLLNTIDNPLRDVYVTGALRSEVFGFTDDELLAIRRLHPGCTDADRSMWQSLKDLAADPQEGGALSEKCASFLSVIEHFRKIAVGCASDKLLLRLYSELHLLNVVSEHSFNRYTDSAPLRRENLMILYDLARNFEKTSFRGLSAFLDFLTERAKNPADIRAAAASGERGAVRIMSVHHAKGLEFPVCILCGLSGRFNKRDEGSLCVYSDSKGVAFKLMDLPSMTSSDSATSSIRYDTPFRTAIRNYETRQLLEEQKRLLYVAMTRAKDRLILLLKKPDDAALDLYYNRGMSESKSYLAHAAGFYEWLNPLLLKYAAARVLYSDADRRIFLSDASKSFCVRLAEPHSVYRSGTSPDAAPPTQEEIQNEDELCRAIREKLSFRYPYARLCGFRSKISVSEIKEGGLFENEARTVLPPSPEELNRPAFLSEGEPDPAARGTAMHTFMQYADYQRCADGSTASVQREAARLLECGFLTGEQYALLQYPPLAAFFDSPLFAALSAAKNVLREYSFTLNVPLSSVDRDLGRECAGESMLVQGKIDCFFERADGGFTVVDFKTDRVKSLDVLAERYRLQLAYYRRAVCEMTGNDDVRTVIYSFFHGKSIEVFCSSDDLPEGI